MKDLNRLSQDTVVSPPRLKKETTITPFDDKINGLDLDCLPVPKTGVVCKNTKEDNPLTTNGHSITKKQNFPFTDNDTWEKKVEETKEKLYSTSTGLLGNSIDTAVMVKKKKAMKFRNNNNNNNNEDMVARALGDILTERILDMDPTLIDTVPVEEWESLLALPVEVMEDILWQIEFHADQGLVFGWKGIQSMVLTHQMGMKPTISLLE